MTNKITKAMRNEDIIAILTGSPVKYGTTIEDAVKHLTHENDLLTRKNSGEHKPTKTQQENEGVKAVILEVMALMADPATITDIQKADERLSDLSNQKVASLMRQMVKAEQVIRSEVKGRAYFTLV